MGFSYKIFGDAGCAWEFTGELWKVLKRVVLSVSQFFLSAVLTSPTSELVDDKGRYTRTFHVIGPLKIRAICLDSLNRTRLISF